MKWHQLCYNASLMHHQCIVVMFCICALHLVCHWVEEEHVRRRSEWTTPCYAAVSERWTEADPKKNTSSAQYEPVCSLHVSLKTRDFHKNQLS